MKIKPLNNVLNRLIKKSVIYTEERETVELGFDKYLNISSFNNLLKNSINSYEDFIKFKRFFSASFLVSKLNEGSSYDDVMPYSSSHRDSNTTSSPTSSTLKR